MSSVVLLKSVAEYVQEVTRASRGVVHRWAFGAAVTAVVGLMWRMRE